VVGIIKFLLISSAGLCCCKISWDIFGIKDKCAKMLGPCRCAFAIVLFVWWVVDWARILTDEFPDGNNRPLIPW
jgi:hypothetical protein